MSGSLQMMRWRNFMVDVISWIAFCAICCAMLLTVGDIAVRAASQIAQWLTGDHPGWGFFGLVDLTQLAMMAAMPLAIAAAFFANTHIRVDLILCRLPSSTQKHVIRIAALVGIGLMGICVWTAWGEMRNQLSFVTTSATLGVAYTWYWVPLIAGLALSVLGCIFTIVCPTDVVGHDV